MPTGFLDFGLALSDPEERDLATRIFYQLAKIEQEIRGNFLAPSIACEDELTFEEKYVLTGLVYYPHRKHVDAVLVVLVDSLHTLTSAIDDIDNADVKILLRDWYCLLKAQLCMNEDAQAYYFSKSR